MAGGNKSIRNFNWRTFLLIVFLTTIVSVLVKLNKNFNYTLHVPLTFKNLPENKILKKYSVDEVQVLGRTTGYNYLNYAFGTIKFPIDLSQLKLIDSTRYYYVFSKDDTDFNKGQVPNVIRRFEPDTVFFMLDDNFEKTLPITSRITLDFEPGYGSLEGLKLNLDSAKVRGPKSDLDTLKVISTKVLKISKVKANLNDSIPLEIVGGSDLLAIYPKKAVYSLYVDKFTEGTIQLPLTVINVPSNITAKVFPKKVNLIFNVNYENYDRVQESDFKVVCDFNEIDSTSTTLTPKIVQYPDYVRDIRIKEKSIQYLLVK